MNRSRPSRARIVIVSAAVLALSVLGCATTSQQSSVAAAMVNPLSTPVTSIFTVDFHGIILHAKIDDYTRRAVVISGDIGRRHTPVLGVILPDDPKEQRALKRALMATTGQILRCNKWQCFVRISNIAMRIRGTTDTLPKQNGVLVPPDESFDCLVPHLAEEPVLGGAILPDVVKPIPARRAHLPSMPAVGFFQIENGNLEATKFERTGYFKDGTNTCREFAQIVTWSGETDGPARLEIASDLTAWDFEDIPTGNRGPLMLYVENLADDGHPSSEHFAMNSKLLTNKNLPEIVVNDCPVAENDKCPASVAFSAILVVPGCSDNTWP